MIKNSLTEYFCTKIEIKEVGIYSLDGYAMYFDKNSTNLNIWRIQGDNTDIVDNLGPRMNSVLGIRSNLGCKFVRLKYTVQRAILYKRLQYTPHSYKITLRINLQTKNILTCSGELDVGLGNPT